MRMHQWTTRVKTLLLLLVLYCNASESVSNPFSSRNFHNNRLPEVPSTLLKLHKIYTSHPPHNTALYQILRVSPNATTAEIQKSYRKLSRQFHPDKHRHDWEEDGRVGELERVQHAYEILKDDATRLPYHKYGLQDSSTAVLLLTGYQNSPKIPTPEEKELLQLMGFRQQQQPPFPPPPRIGQPLAPLHPPSQEEKEEQRIRFLAATILERIRPMVEGTISERTVADFVATECDRLKRLPLGAHILRCVGRAYRHAGQRYHCRRDPPKQQQPRKRRQSKWPIRDAWHDVQHVWTAAMATWRVARKEDRWIRTTTSTGKPESGDTMGGIFEEDSLESDDYDDEEEMQKQEIFKRNKVLIDVLQVDALWKVHKIGLNRAVREACYRILSGKYFFFPSHQSTHLPDEWRQAVDGWVGTSNTRHPSVIDANEGRLRAASALVLIGNVMVQSSKEGTAWME